MIKVTGRDCPFLQIAAVFSVSSLTWTVVSDGGQGPAPDGGQGPAPDGGQGPAPDGGEPLLQDYAQGK